MRLTAPALAMMLAALGDAMTNGSVELYAGDAPGVPGGASSTATLLAEFRFRGFSVSASGELEAAPMTSGQALQTGTPRWFRVRAADRRAVLDGDVGTGLGQLQVSPVPLIQGGRVDGAGFTLGWKK